MAGGNAHEQSRQHSEFAGQNVGDYASLGVDENGIEAALIATHVAPGALEGGKPAIVEQKPGNEIEPFVSRRSANSSEARQPLPIGQNLFGHYVEWPRLCRSAAINQPLQPAKILMRVAQPVDVVEAQPMQRPIRDETLHKSMDRVECAAVFNAQSGQRVDIEKPPVIDLASGKLPMREPIMLAFEQVVQGEGGIRSSGSGSVGPQPAFDHFLAARNGSEFGLKDRRRLTRRIMRAAIALRPLQQLSACGLLARACLCHDFLQDLAVAVRRDGQPMLEIPSGKAAFGCVIA